MRIRHSGAAAIVAVLLVAGAAQAATVTVRIEGANGTLLPRTQVTTSPDPVPGAGCAGDTVAGAIDVATNGNWDRQSFTQTILGETHNFSNNDYWAEWLDYKYGGGICTDVVHDGDEVLMLVDYGIATPPFVTVFPLRILDVPASAQQGAPFTITVVKYETDSNGDPGTGNPVPEEGVTVTGGGASATTDASGHATLTLPTAGSFTLRATKSGDAPSAAEPVTVTPLGTPPPYTIPPTPDRTPPLASISGIREHQKFRHRHGPRTLHGTVSSDPSGIKDVKLRLTRTYKHHCYVFSNHKARFVRSRCGADRAKFFSIGAHQSWSYLLPARLGPGRYVLDVTAIDGASNRDATRVPGRNRVVFTVG
jgi:hypothetical protein